MHHILVDETREEKAEGGGDVHPGAVDLFLGAAPLVNQGVRIVLCRGGTDALARAAGELGFEDVEELVAVDAQKVLLNAPFPQALARFRHSALG